MTDASDGEYDVFLDSLADGRGYYYACSNGHGTVPPRRVCPHCGDRDLERIPLPETGEIRTYSTVNVPTPAFDDDAPYVTAIASFGPVRLTGIVRGSDPTDVEIGTPVAATVEPRETTDERTITFRPDDGTHN
ncbi:Zn-ribbon domain-containing OB-fold protein [Natrinema ejinorense]|uniref:Nucleic acid-binding protein n=1 Tax=Natrinema ejinorense TaxID=373386 RepID=A0A2A5QPJ4_9EURY|nr:Zn-ribbon domain-containing OB-fold protein [Natrinema ejinorense]PCR88771.1 nucleic acid-binding protein [Natrinema ejinorense]